ncbi:hypothetical protein DL96DRAFT_1628816 [Flagelloscypha sp. PMI_526]|nr:hypothetical protein DL96DRAFT_1628816 [Flagelloscypha sp. PMI_526]
MAGTEVSVFKGSLEDRLPPELQIRIFIFATDSSSFPNLNLILVAKHVKGWVEPHRWIAFSVPINPVSSTSQALSKSRSYLRHLSIYTTTSTYQVSLMGFCHTKTFNKGKTPPITSLSFRHTHPHRIGDFLMPNLPNLRFLKHLALNWEASRSLKNCLEASSDWIFPHLTHIIFPDPYPLQTKFIPHRFPSLAYYHANLWDQSQFIDGMKSIAQLSQIRIVAIGKRHEATFSGGGQWHNTIRPEEIFDHRKIVILPLGWDMCWMPEGGHWADHRVVEDRLWDEAERIVKEKSSTQSVA